jgi:hypothetical protein
VDELMTKEKEPAADPDCQARLGGVQDPEEERGKELLICMRKILPPKGNDTMKSPSEAVFIYRSAKISFRPEQVFDLSDNLFGCEASQFDFAGFAFRGKQAAATEGERNRRNSCLFFSSRTRSFGSGHIFGCEVAKEAAAEADFADAVAYSPDDRFSVQHVNSCRIERESGSGGLQNCLLAGPEAQHPVFRRLVC